MIKEFVKKIVSLDNVHQWAERDSVVKESVSQHSFKVAAFAIYVFARIEAENKYVRLNDVYILFRSVSVNYAVLHDFDEAILGRDISHVVKYNRHNGDNIRKELDDYVDYEIRRIGLQFINDDISTYVKSFVKMCDWLAMLTFIYRNKAMGVTTFESELEYCRNKVAISVEVVKSFLSKSFEVLNFDFIEELKQDYIYEQGSSNDKGEH